MPANVCIRVARPSDQEVVCRLWQQGLTEHAEELVAAQEEVVPPEVKTNGKQSWSRKSPEETAMSRLVKVINRDAATVWQGGL